MRVASLIALCAILISYSSDKLVGRWYQEEKNAGILYVDGKKYQSREELIFTKEGKLIRISFKATPGETRDSLIYSIEEDSLTITPTWFKAIPPFLSNVYQDKCQFSYSPNRLVLTYDHGSYYYKRVD